MFGIQTHVYEEPRKTMVAEVTNPKIYLLSLKELLVHTVRSLLTIL